MGKIREFLSNPTVAFIGSIASIVGIVLTLYFYFDSVKSPNLIYSVSTEKTTIVNSAELNNIKISYLNSAVVGDISALQFSIWNSGKSPILQSDILSQVRFSIDNNVKILDAKIIESSRPVIDFSLNPENYATGHLGLSWKILEEGDGATIQIIYVGKTNEKTNIVGQIIGQKKISEFIPSINSEFKGKEKIPSKVEVALTYLEIFTSLMFIVFIIFFIVFYGKEIKKNVYAEFTQIKVSALMVIAALMLIQALITLYYSYSKVLDMRGIVPF